MSDSADPSRPTKRFDLGEQEAVDLVHELRQQPGVFDLSVCIGGKRSGTTENARAVYFGCRLASGHAVRASIHSGETTDGPAVNGQADSTPEAMDETTQLLRDIVDD